VARTSLRARLAGLTAVAAVLAGSLAVDAAPANAANPNCPTVDPTTGAVTPPPTPGVDWDTCNLTDANLTSATLNTANLSNANLTSANLTSANLTSADLDGATLTSANLSSAVLSDAFLNDAVLTDANIASANFSGASLTDVISGGLTSATPPTLPAGFELLDAFLVGPGVDLTDAGLAGANLDSLNLSDAILTGADLDNASLTSANLQGASLGQASLVDANLTGADLNDADISGTDFTGATLNQVSSGGLTGTPLHLPPNWLLAAGYLVGPGADLQDADLASISLPAVDLFDANLTGASLVNADLSSADLQGADLASVTTGETDLQAANLDGGDLQGASIDSTDLEQATLSDANLSDASVDSSNLQNADLGGANLTGTIWNNTVCPNGTNSDTQNPQVCTAALAGPVASPTVTAGTLGSDNWFTSPVTITWNWSDNTTTIDPRACTLTSTTSGNGDPITLTASCTDAYGNTGTATVAVKVDMTRPVVSVVGLKSAAIYTYGRVPRARCQTTEKVSGVKSAAKPRVYNYGKGGVGLFVVQCAGAQSVAGLQQAKPVNLTYAVATRFGGFKVPKPGSSVSRSAGTIAVRFRLTTATGRPVSASTEAAVAKARFVRVTLSGPDIAPTSAICSWNAGARMVECAIKIPPGVRTGPRERYTITAIEDLGYGYVVTLTGKGAADPEVIHFS
jgi:uncharacterized protein YjbI with pentapeptide repeats